MRSQMETPEFLRAGLKERREAQEGRASKERTAEREGWPADQWVIKEQPETQKRLLDPKQEEAMMRELHAAVQKELGGMQAKTQSG